MPKRSVPFIQILPSKHQDDSSEMSEIESKIAYRSCILFISFFKFFFIFFNIFIGV